MEYSSEYELEVYKRIYTKISPRYYGKSYICILLKNEVEIDYDIHISDNVSKKLFPLFFKNKPAGVGEDEAWFENNDERINFLKKLIEEIERENRKPLNRVGKIIKTIKQWPKKRF